MIGRHWPSSRSRSSSTPKPPSSPPNDVSQRLLLPPHPCCIDEFSRPSWARVNGRSASAELLPKFNNNGRNTGLQMQLTIPPSNYIFHFRRSQPGSNAERASIRCITVTSREWVTVWQHSGLSLRISYLHWKCHDSCPVPDSLQGSSNGTDDSRVAAVSLHEPYLANNFNMLSSLVHGGWPVLVSSDRIELLLDSSCPQSRQSQGMMIDGFHFASTVRSFDGPHVVHDIPASPCSSWSPGGGIDRLSDSFST